MPRRRDWPFRGPFGWGFGDLDDVMERMLETLREQGERGEHPEPLMMGFTVEVGPDGRPRVEQFGNVQQGPGGRLEEGAREPFTSTVVDEEAGELVLTAEMPGVEKGDVRVHATEESVALEARRDGRHYRKEVALGVPVDPDSASARYNNGVLEVKLDLKRRGGEGREVEVR